MKSRESRPPAVAGLFYEDDPRRLRDSVETRAELSHRVIYKERISMCGVLPATVLLAALSQLPPTKAVLLGHGDSADNGGDEDRVVGYASIVWEVLEEVS